MLGVTSHQGDGERARTTRFSIVRSDVELYDHQDPGLSCEEDH